MIKVGAIFESAFVKKDGSASIRLTTDNEISEEEVLEFFRHRGLSGWLIFAEDGIQDIKIPQEDANPKKLSYSQRMRRSLWQRQRHELRRKPTEEEAEAYYRQYMEKSINKILDF